VGYWYVAPHPAKPDASARVFYSVKLLPGELVPGFVVDILQKQVWHSRYDVGTDGLHASSVVQSVA